MMRPSDCGSFCFGPLFRSATRRPPNAYCWPRKLRDALTLHYNPDWPSQPRVLTGSEAGRRTVDFDSGGGGKHPPKLVAAKTKNFDYACKALKLDRHKASDVLHDIKPWWQIPTRQTAHFDANTGDITFDGKIVGNLRG